MKIYRKSELEVIQIWLNKIQKRFLCVNHVYTTNSFAVKETKNYQDTTRNSSCNWLQQPLANTN